MTQGFGTEVTAALGHFAGATPLLVISDFVNVAGFTKSTIYTVPAGKATVITSMTAQQRGGTAYTFMGWMANVAGAGTEGILKQAAPSGQLTIHWEGNLWIAATDVVYTYVNGGDSTSDYRSVISGLEFDA